MLTYPVEIRVNPGIDAGFPSQTAQYAPAGNARQLPRLPIAGLSDERTTGVARARVATTLLVPGTHHVGLDTSSVPTTLATRRVRHHRYYHLVQHVVATRPCIMHIKRAPACCCCRSEIITHLTLRH